MALQRQLKRFPAVLLPTRLMDLLPASGFRIRSGNLPVRTGATKTSAAAIASLVSEIPIGRASTQFARAPEGRLQSRAESAVRQVRRLAPSHQAPPMLKVALAFTRRSRRTER